MADHEHVFANPAPAGLIALAMACWTFWAMYTGRVTGGAAPVLAAWMIGGGLVQYATGLIELRNGAIKGGCVFLFFGAFFMFVTALSLITKYLLAQNGMPFDARIEGYAWMACAIGLILFTPAYATKSPKFMFFLVVIVDICLVLIALMDMNAIPKAVYAPPTGWMLFIVGCMGLYLAGGIMINSEYGRSIVPLTTPLVKDTPKKGVAA